MRRDDSEEPIDVIAEFVKKMPNLTSLTTEGFHAVPFGFGFQQRNSDEYPWNCCPPCSKLTFVSTDRVHLPYLRKLLDVLKGRLPSATQIDLKFSNISRLNGELFDEVGRRAGGHCEWMDCGDQFSMSCDESEDTR